MASKIPEKVNSPYEELAGNWGKRTAVYYDPDRDNTKWETGPDAAVTRPYKWHFYHDAAHAARKLVQDKLKAGPNPELELARWEHKVNKYFEFDWDITQVWTIERTPLKYPMVPTTYTYHMKHQPLLFDFRSFPKQDVVYDESYRDLPYPPPK